MIKVMSTIYLAGRLDTGEGTIAEFANELESRGHEVIEKWWEKGRLPKPYLDHPEISWPAAKAMIDAAYSCDVFAVFPTDDILGAAVEFGAAIASTSSNPDKQVIVVNPFEVRQSVFYAHPSVIAVNGLSLIRQLSFY
jgi:hypothetical protein